MKATKLYIYDKSSSIDRDQAAGRFIGDNDVLTIGVLSGKNLEKVFEQLANWDQKFNRVVFQTHGSPGAIKFANDYVFGLTWKNHFRGYEKLFPRYTRMYFDGCNVAQGEFGTDFLLAAGSVFLHGGGEAFAWKNLGWGQSEWMPFIRGHTIHFGGESNLKRIRFFPGGLPNWPDSSV